MFLTGNERKDGDSRLSKTKSCPTSDKLSYGQEGTVIDVFLNIGYTTDHMTAFGLDFGRRPSQRGKEGMRVRCYRVRGIAGSTNHGEGMQKPLNLLKSIFVPIALGAVISLCASPGAGASGIQPCTNENLRSMLGLMSLPDCRAYEMVTPPYKEGYPMFARSLASDGNSVILESLATLAGTRGSSSAIPEAVFYRVARTANGWQLTALNPLLSEFVGQVPLAAEADSGETLWEQHTPRQPAWHVGVYRRSPAGDFDFMGLLRPPEVLHEGEEEESGLLLIPLNRLDAPVAATYDYGHLVLEARFPEARWPFDQTEGAETHSLYEYSGANSEEPTLVGVSGPKGSRQLIGQCGTTLGAGVARTSLDAYNALSSDGETIFFTVAPCGSAPAYAELYARVHGAESSAAMAETVHISESECTVACGEESGKDFEGASQDGSRVFFTSTQKLTNDATDGTASGNATEGRGCARTHAGALGCNLYEYDRDAQAGSHLRMVSVGGEVLGVLGVAEDGSRIYYVTRAVIATAGDSVYHQSPVEGSPNMYVYDAIDGKTAFIATLGTQDERAWGREFLRPTETSGSNGQFLLFASSAPNITPDDTSAQTQLYEYKAASHENAVSSEPAELVRVTKGEDGFNEDGNGVTVGIEPSSVETVAARLGFQRDFKSTTNRLNISTDGRSVFFETAGRLSPRATSAERGCTSLYTFHADDGLLSQGIVSLISDGYDVQLNKGSGCGAELQYVDSSGENALFSTADPLLSGDVDGVQRDIYDARANGGFLQLSAMGRCDAESCEGTASAPAPPMPIPGSANSDVETPATTTALRHESSSGKGNAALARALRACKRKRVKRKATCERAARRRFASKSRASRTRRNG